jgi:hypothetical protein
MGATVPSFHFPFLLLLFSAFDFLMHGLLQAAKVTSKRSGVELRSAREKEMGRRSHGSRRKPC